MATKLNPALKETPAQWANNTGKTARYNSTASLKSGSVQSEKQLDSAVNSEKTVNSSPRSSKPSPSKKTPNKPVSSGMSPAKTSRYGSNIKIRKSLLG